MAGRLVPEKAAEKEWDEWAERMWLALSCFAAGYIAASWHVLVKLGAAAARVCAGVHGRLGRLGVQGEHAAAAGGRSGPAKALLQRESLSPVGERQHGSMLAVRRLSPSACRVTGSPGAGRAGEPGGAVRPQQAEASAGTSVHAASGRGPVRIHAVGRLAIWTNQRRGKTCRVPVECHRVPTFEASHPRHFSRSLHAARQLERTPDAPCTRSDRKQHIWLDSNELAPRSMPRRIDARAAGDGRLHRTRVLGAGAPRAAARRAVDGWELCGHGCAGRSAGKVRGGE
jgi:hypothetical protein